MTPISVGPASPSMIRSSITSPNTGYTNSPKRPRRDSSSDTSSSSSCQTKPLSASITLPIVGTRVLDNIIDRLLPTVDLTTEPSSLSEGGSVTSSSMSSVASTTTATSTIPKRMDNKETISSPQEFFTAMLQDRGYPATMVCSLKCGYHNTPTKHQITSYGLSLTKAIRSSDTTTARSLLAAGLHPNACNKFGESIVHAACRRGDLAMLHALLEFGSSVQITDDFGRTPLHDACWTSSPNFDVVRLLLEEDPWLLCVMDCRGSAPLGYARKAHWAVWIGFLGVIVDRYWPSLKNDDEGEEGKNIIMIDRDESKISDRDKVPPLAHVEPNSSPLPDPKLNVLDLDIIELLANGKLTPQDLANEGSNTELVDPKTYQERQESNGPTTSSSAPCSRITLDPMRQMGFNATTMLKGSNNTSTATSLQGFVQVTATHVITPAPSVNSNNDRGLEQNQIDRSGHEESPPAHVMIP
eukprot:CAMPEP_0202032842 /NCGR_PEP_ID=MMETSP0905-20130828/65735_1 /ASSEMBLY_ACC=CAM_ASM_000554 /TAXON_ID=420261 /ORGANISM="Thalassiosira antarctica, Strain CCMP982" /LENGTH=468 /DNA_ID=CAMNT_0048596715 /DNA_START=578 /DNA_END=1984 /DNA_ORIENTATION=-